MRICVPIPCFFGGMDFCDAIRKVGSLGFDCVETYGWKGLDLDLVKKTTEETGVELLSMCTTEFRMTDPTYRQAWLDGLKESCEAANRAGATRLITQVGQDTGAPREAQHEAIVETLIAAKPILEELQKIGGLFSGGKYADILWRGMAIGITVQLTADTVRDFGEGGLADRVEVVGRAVLLCIGIPLYKELFSLAGRFFGM